MLTTGGATGLIILFKTGHSLSNFVRQYHNYVQYFFEVVVLPIRVLW